MKRLLVKGMHFVDEDGNQVIMNGINLVCKEKSQGYLEPNTMELLEYYASHGFNLVRLGIFWDGVEPQPGSYDDAYLDHVEKVIRRADELGVYILLDMHQDLFGAKYGDGAPDWATLDEGLYHPENCTMWYEAYTSSQAIARAADNFWANAKASDGLGLLDHYATMWEHLARKLHSCTNIIGFEPMNEPFMGSIAPQAFGMAIAKIMEVNPGFDPNNMQSAGMEEQTIMKEVLSEQFMRFDREILMPFYNRITEAVRKVCTIPIATGGNIYSSSFVPTGITTLSSADGSRDTQQVYTPHGYDAVTDSDRYDAFNKENVYHIFSQKRISQLELGLPVIVGEWGAFPSKPFTNDLIEHMNSILEAYLWSSAYWVYRPGMENDPYFSSLERGYPVQVAGNLLTYHYNSSSKHFMAKWEARKNGETVFYIPDLSDVSEEDIVLSAKAYVKIAKVPQGSGGYVTVIDDEDGILDILIRS